MKAHFKLYPAALVLAGMLLALSPARAQTRTATLNTGILSGQGTFLLQYNLANGLTTPDGNATAVISNFSLTGGSLGDPTTVSTVGDAAGNLGTAVTLRDDNTGTAGFATFEQAFTVNNSASTLSFNLNLAATSVDPGSTNSTKDDFFFQILDSAGEPLATNGPNFTELVNASYTTISPTPMGFTTQASSPLTPGSVDLNYPGITATITPAPVPEASTTVSLGLLLLLGGAGLWRARRRSAAH